MKKILLILAIQMLCSEAHLVAQNAPKITMIAGNGEKQAKVVAGKKEIGDNGPATAAVLELPCSITEDADGNYYVAEHSGKRIRKIDKKGMITTFAGGGTSDITDYNARILANQFDIGLLQNIVADSKSNIYFTKEYGKCIYKIDVNGLLTIFAGHPHIANFNVKDGDDVKSAFFIRPVISHIDKQNNLFLWNYSQLFKITSDSRIHYVAGNIKGTQSKDYEGLNIKDIAFSVNSLCSDNSGNLYFTFDRNNHVYKAGADGIIHTIAGNQSPEPNFCGDGLLATMAGLNNPKGVVVDADDNVYIADFGNDRIRRVTKDGKISTIAGNGKNTGYFRNGAKATETEISEPHALFLDNEHNLLFIGNDNIIYKISL